MQFQYETYRSNKCNELESLPFASDIQLEKQVFQLALSAEFEADFRSWRQSLKSWCSFIPSFRRGFLPALKALGGSKDFWLARPLSGSESLKFIIKGSLLNSIWFQNIDREEINRAMKALVEKHRMAASALRIQEHYFDDPDQRIRRDLRKN